MGWYIRKSFSTGPVRFNLSKSGMGVSFGAKGARIGLGPRGMYTHLGRGGLYYRSSYSGFSRADKSSDDRRADVKTSYQESINNESPMSTSTALFDDRQIKYKKLKMELELKKSNKKDGIYFLISIVAFILGGYFDSIKHTIVSYIFLFLGLGFLIAIPYRLVYHLIHKYKSFRFYKILTNKLLNTQDNKIDFEQFEKILESTNLSGKYRDFALYRFYRDYVNNILSDIKITETESKDLQKLEETLNLDASLLKLIKKWVFNKTYLIIIEDKVLSREEEENIFHAKNILLLSDEDIEDEMDTLDILRTVRKINEEDISPIQVNIQLADKESCFHKTKGRMIKEKIVRSYQSEGVRHKVTDLVIEKEGDLYLTSKRIFIVGDGVYTIKLEKVFNVETDIDKNMVSLDVEGRKTPLQITVPDSYIFSAKLNKLLKPTIKY